MIPLLENSMHIWGELKDKLKESFTNPLKAYEHYFALPLPQRVRAATALFIFTFTFAGVFHLMLTPLPNNLLIGLYVYAGGVAGLLAVGVLVPSLRRYRKMYVVVLMVLGALQGYFSADYGYRIGQSLVPGTSLGAWHSNTDWQRVVVGTAVFVGFLVSESLFRRVTRFIANEKARADAEIALAQRIQTLLLPPVRLERSDYTVVAQTQTAAEVGGDYFEVLELPEGKLFVAIGDVSGHNVGAGVLMAMLKSGVRTALQHTHDLVALTTSLNTTLLENKEKSMFVSFQCAVISPAEQTLTIVHAGHLPLLRRSQGNQQAEPNGQAPVQVQEHRTPSLALGLSKHAKFTAEIVRYERGDQVVLLTDGIVEAMNAEREEFGIERVKTLLHADLCDPADLAKRLSEEVQRFTGQPRTEDDRTIVVINV